MSTASTLAAPDLGCGRHRQDPRLPEPTSRTLGSDPRWSVASSVSAMPPDGQEGRFVAESERRPGLDHDVGCIDRRMLRAVERAAEPDPRPATPRRARRTPSPRRPPCSDRTAVGQRLPRGPGRLRDPRTRGNQQHPSAESADPRSAKPAVNLIVSAVIASSPTARGEQRQMRSTTTSSSALATSTSTRWWLAPDMWKMLVGGAWGAPARRSWAPGPKCAPRREKSLNQTAAVIDSREERALS